MKYLILSLALSCCNPHKATWPKYRIACSFIDESQCCVYKVNRCLHTYCNSPFGGHDYRGYVALWPTKTCQIPENTVFVEKTLPHRELNQSKPTPIQGPI